MQSPAQRQTDPLASRGLPPRAVRAHLPAIDLVHLSRQTLGDRALETELLRLFDRQASQIMERLHACASGDRKALGDLAHTIKGSARAIGAIDVAAAAQACEDTLRPGSPLATDAALARLDERIAAAREAIASLLGE
jgi:HPt (histidine-containing phosphotransfer) domain-containing protein